ncbi:MAG: tRNA-(ms[2]io[6]A)-hydroxylase [Alphaproteobacteria bacterium]|nr:tRNA-(ms[2]io[6]A)-hydroxylase [Alphaproteobacteria bacterium]
MLRLASATPPAWVDAVAAQVDLLLLDHAHCEKKAASTAMNLMFRHGDQPGLVRALTALAREELDHLAEMLDVLEARGLAFARLEPSPYAARLLTAVRRGEPHRLVDTLLCCALIEARSCERMRLLSLHLPDPDLRALYADLLASEARHFHTYVDLTKRLHPGVDVDDRLAELARHEARILEGPVEARMHGTFPADPS